MEVKNILFSELDRAGKLPFVNGKTVSEFDRFIRTNDNLIRENNTKYHICSFFLPVHIPSQSIYLVHHIKAQDWIPPGGHIDAEESPLATVKREYTEELSYRITNENIRLMNLTVKHIRSTRHPCRTHYDFWYTVEMETLYPFIFDLNEFYDAKWFPLHAGLKKMKLSLYRTAVNDSVISLFRR